MGGGNARNDGVFGDGVVGGRGLGGRGGGRGGGRAGRQGGSDRGGGSGRGGGSVRGGGSGRGGESVRGGVSNEGGSSKRQQDVDVDDEEDSFEAPKRMRTTEILLESDWPEGYSIERIDGMSVRAANEIKTRQVNARVSAKKTEREELPGVRVARKSLKLKTVDVKAGQDNAFDVLHDARFLRPVTCPPAKYYDRVAISWEPKVPEFAQEWLGTSCQIPKKTFLSCQDRGIALQPKHFCEKNYHVDKSASKATARFGEGGMEVAGFKKEYYDPSNIHEMIMCIMNMMCVYFVLWPMDYTPIVIMRVALEFDFFSVCKDQKMRVKIFDKFITQVLDTNASDPTKPPQTFDQVKEIAKTILKANHLPSVPPIDHKYYQDAVASQGSPGDYRGRGRGDGQRRPRGRGFDSGRGSGRADSWRDGGHDNWKDGGRDNWKDGGRPNSVGRLEVGRIPPDNSQLKLGNDRICKDYQFGRCHRELDAAGRSCKMGNGKLLHLCGTTLKVNGGVPRLCVGEHSHQDCNKRK